MTIPAFSPSAEPAAAGQYGHATAVAKLACRLTTARSQADVLDSLCGALRAALGLPVAYVALNQDGREAVVSRSDGVTTAGFRALCLPHSAGLGVVAGEGVVRATADYISDRGLRHVPELDRRVADEGLRGIVAVPIRIPGATPPARRWVPYAVAAASRLTRSPSRKRCRTSRVWRSPTMTRNETSRRASVRRTRAFVNWRS